MAGKEMEATQLVGKLPLFSALEAEEISRVAARVRLVDAPRGTFLFRAGDACNGFHAVLSGGIKLVLEAPPDAEKVLDLVGPGQTFGEAVMFLEKPYLVSAAALEDSKLLFVPRVAVLCELDVNPRFGRRLLAGLSARLHRLVSDVEAYSLRSGKQRVAQYLLGTLRPRDAGAGTGAFPVAKRTIASRLNLTQEHFSRILHELSAAGLIQVAGRMIFVPDVGRLRTLAHEGASR
ncbi:MAG: Crp/Fnr family transcriptional regulator [Rhodospirillaceae bacterium]